MKMEKPIALKKEIKKEEIENKILRFRGFIYHRKIRKGQVA